MSDVQICEWLQNKLHLEDLCMTNLSTSTTRNLLSFCIHSSGWIVGGEFAQFEHWSLRRGQGRPGNIICAHSCCCRQYKKSFLVPIYLSISKKMDAAQTHFGPMLCTVWSCNGHLPNCALHDPKCVWAASRCVWASPGTSLMDKRAVREKEERQPSHTIRLPTD